MSGQKNRSHNWTPSELSDFCDIAAAVEVSITNLWPLHVVGRHPELTEKSFWGSRSLTKINTAYLLLRHS
jgi:hypothetical protein